MARTQQDLQNLMTRRNPLLQRKAKIYEFIADSYAGGEQFLSKNYLFKYPREMTKEYEARKQRTSYWNYVQPVADILTGLLFTEKPTRKPPESLNYLLELACKGETFDQFMQKVAINALQFPCGILVDSPEFDQEQIKTKADRIAEKLNPYCVLYEPWKIRDFCFDKSGKLEWVLLNNTTDDSYDPFKPRERVVSYRLWQRTQYQDFEIRGNAKDITEKPPVITGLKEIPFVFAAWKNIDSQQDIGETPFEDIALNGRSIYNYLSLLDEMMNSGTFQVLFYPVAGNQTVPKDLKEQGVGNLTAVPFDGTLTQKPFFDGGKLEEVERFLKVIDRFEKNILAKVGLDKDSEKNYVQSGVAKSLEFRKTHALLTLGAENLEKVEKEIFRFAAMWESETTAEDLKIDISYPKKFDPNEVERRVAELYALLSSLPYKTVKTYVVQEIIRLSFPEAEQKKLNALLKAVETEEPDSTESIVDKVLKSATPGGDTATKKTTAAAETGE